MQTQLLERLNFIQSLADPKKEPKDIVKEPDISKYCCCLERAGDNPNCPVHYPKK